MYMDVELGSTMYYSGGTKLKGGLNKNFDVLPINFECG